MPEVLIPDLPHPVSRPIVRGIEDGLRAAGYTAPVGNTEGDVIKEHELVTAMRSRLTDGLIVATARRADDARRGAVSRPSL